MASVSDIAVNIDSEFRKQGTIQVVVIVRRVWLLKLRLRAFRLAVGVARRMLGLRVDYEVRIEGE